MTYSIVIINYLTTKKNQIKKKNQVPIPDVVLEITTILTIFGIKRTTTILMKIEKAAVWNEKIEQSKWKEEIL